MVNSGDDQRIVFQKEYVIVSNYHQLFSHVQADRALGHEARLGNLVFGLSSLVSLGGVEKENHRVKATDYTSCGRPAATLSGSIDLVLGAPP